MEMTMGSHERAQKGFALILAILALMLLTFLGLTLAATTSTELQIASNFRWGQQAYYNAEAGLEAGKVILRNIPNNWGAVLPSQRGGSWAWGSPPAPGVPQSATATRNFENEGCDSLSGNGTGGVLDDTQAMPLLLGETPAGPYQNVKTFRGMTLTGAFTLWVRRDVIVTGVGQYQDSGDNNTLVLIAEGSAPGLATAPGSSVRLLQVLLTRNNQGNTSCSAAEGQTGIAASGANFGACAPLNSASITPLSGPGGGLGGDTGVK
jgi:hypothetical protein